MYYIRCIRRIYRTASLAMRFGVYAQGTGRNICYQPSPCLTCLSTVDLIVLVLDSVNDFRSGIRNKYIFEKEKEQTHSRHGTNDQYSPYAKKRIRFQDTLFFIF